MTTVEPEVTLTPEGEQLVADAEQEEKKRRKLLLALLALLLGLCAVLCVSVGYLLNPVPLPDLLPGAVVQVNNPPTYKFSIIGVDGPMGVAVSPDGQRVYVSEGEGERLIKMFDRDGQLIKSFSPPGTNKSNRLPAYIAIDASGRVYVVDRYNGVINLFDADGNFIDAIIGRELTLSKFVASQNGGTVPEGTEYYYNNIDKKVYYALPGQPVQAADANRGPFGPLGLRFDAKGNLMVTNLITGRHSVLVFPAEAINGSWQAFAPQVNEFGAEGSGAGQISFPNSVATNSRGDFFVSDANNSRIQYWNGSAEYVQFFGFGSSEAGLNLPNGVWMDGRDRLHVVDAVGQAVRVYSTTSEQPSHLYTFGVMGVAEGEFFYPNDITMDQSGRLYISDRGNNRVQIWSY